MIHIIVKWYRDENKFKAMKKLLSLNSIDSQISFK